MLSTAGPCCLRRRILARMRKAMPGWALGWFSTLGLLAGCASFDSVGGGDIEFGEDPSAAMVREVREETGLEVRAAGLAGLDSLVVPNKDSTMHSLRVIYFTELLGGILANEVDGSTDLCEWHDIEAVKSLPIVGLVETGLSLL